MVSLQNTNNISSIKVSAFKDIPDSSFNLIVPNLQSIEGDQSSRGAFYNSGIRYFDASILSSIPDAHSNDSYAYTGVFVASKIEVAKIPNCTYIGRSAFRNCVNLREIDISSATHIGTSSFYNCQSIQSIVANNLLTLSEASFYNCINLSIFDAPLLQSIPKSNNSNYRIFQNSKLQKVNIPSCTYIGDYAFRDIFTLTEINCGNVTYIGMLALSNCQASLIDLSHLTSISDQAMYKCVNIKEIDAPLLQSIPDSNNQNYTTFYGCSSVERINIPSCKTIGKNAFMACSKASILILRDCTFIGDYAFRRCGNIENISGISNITSIGKGAFSFDYNSTAKLSGNLYFESLKTINGSASNWEGAFGKTMISGFFAPSLVQIIGGGTSNHKSALSECSQLKTVMFGESVTALGSYPFHSSAVSTFVIKTSTPPSVTDVFGGCTSATAFVPMDSVSAYQSASGWSGYASRIKGYLEADELPDDNTDADLYFIGDLFYRWENNQWVLKNDPDDMVY